MAFDTHGNLVYSTIQSGGVVNSTTGTTLVVLSGDANKFSVNQNITVWPSGTDPNLGTNGQADNAEIMRVVNVNVQNSTLTVTRAQEGTSALNNIAVGYQVGVSITAKDLTDIESYTNPTGAIIAYGGSSAPTNWLLCDGSAVSRTTYANLFAVLSTTYGSGDGTTTFNVPDLRGRSPLGSGTGTASGATAWSLGSTPTTGAGGEQTHTLTSGESGSPAHGHGITDPQHNHSNNTNATAGGSVRLTGSAGVAANAIATLNSSTGITINNSVAADASNAHNIQSPITVTNFIIKT